MRKAYIIALLLVVVAAAVAVWWPGPRTAAEAGGGGGRLGANGSVSFPARFILVNNTLGGLMVTGDDDINAANLVQLQAPGTTPPLVFYADTDPSSGLTAFRTVASGGRTTLNYDPASFVPGGSGSPGGPDAVAGLTGTIGVYSQDLWPVLQRYAVTAAPASGAAPGGFTLTLPSGQPLSGPPPKTKDPLSVYCGAQTAPWAGATGCGMRNGTAVGDVFTAIDVSAPPPAKFLLGYVSDGTTVYLSTDGSGLNPGARISADIMSLASNGTVSVRGGAYYLRRITDGIEKMIVVTADAAEATAFEFVPAGPLSATTAGYFIRELGSLEFLYVHSNGEIGEKGSDPTQLNATLFVVDSGCAFRAPGIACPASLPLCDPDVGACYPPQTPGCSSDADCGPGYVCDTGRNQCVPNGG